MNPFVLLLRRMQKKNARERIEAHRNDFDLRAERDIPYLEDEDPCHQLDLWLPREREGKIPVILEVHGGAYCSCFKEFNNLHAQYLCREGFAVANMNYTLHPEADMRQEVREIFAARAWIQEKAPLYGFDTERVFLTGDSAGGHLVLLAGGALSRHKTRDFVGLREPPLPFQKIAATCPMGELGNLDKKTERLLKLLLGKVCLDKAYTSQVNFRTFIGEGYPPLLLLTSPQDELLYLHTLSIHENLEKRGIPHVYREYPAQENSLGHVFNVEFPEYVESQQANQDMIQFFKSK